MSAINDVNSHLTVALSSASLIAAVFKGITWPRPDPAPLSLISHPLALTTFQLFVKLQLSSFTRSKYMQAVPKLKIRPQRHMDLITHLLGYFVMHEMGLAKISPYTKFDISSFTHSRFTEGGIKFKKFGPGPWPWWLVGYQDGIHANGHPSQY